MADQQSRGKGPGNLARVDPDTLQAFSATYHTATNRRVFSAAPVHECPADARAAMLLYAKSDDYRECQSLAEVAEAAAMSEGAGRVDDAVSAWVVCRLCSREEMRTEWMAFERWRALAVVGRFNPRESLGADFISAAVGAACDAVRDMRRREPQTKKWLADWRADFGDAVDHLVSALERNPSSDYVWRVCKAEPNILRRLSDALREFRGIELGLMDTLPERQREHAPRAAFAVKLTDWCWRNLETRAKSGDNNRQSLVRCQSLVITAVEVLFGCSYEPKQLRRDLRNKIRVATLTMPAKRD
jgi:hypothetical protein